MANGHGLNIITLDMICIKSTFNQITHEKFNERFQSSNQNLDVIQIFQCLDCLYVLSSINDTRKHKCDAPYFQIVSLVDYLHAILNQLQVQMLL